MSTPPAKTFVKKPLTSLNGYTWGIDVQLQLQHERVHRDATTHATKARILELETRLHHQAAPPLDNAEGPAEPANHADAVAPLNPAEVVELDRLLLNNDVAISILRGNMSESYKILTAEHRFAIDVWTWFKTSFAKKDARAVNSYYTMLRASKYDRSKAPEDLAAQHILLHNLMLDAGEIISEGSKCQAYLSAFEDDELLAAEVKELARDEELNFDKAVIRMENTVKNLILKGALPKPDASNDNSNSNQIKNVAKVNATSATSDTSGSPSSNSTAGSVEEKPPCSFCSNIGKRFASMTHVTSKCRADPSSRFYIKCSICGNAGHNRTCEKRGYKRKYESEGSRSSADDMKVIANFLRSANLQPNDRKH